MLYVISEFLLRLFFRTFWGFKVSGIENVPQEGGFILAPNHVSYLDPPVVGSACPRKVYFMAKIALFHVPVLAGWMRGVGVIPLNRGVSDRASFRKAVELLKQGECVCIFPEGMRVAPGVKKEAEPGIVFLAKMAGVPVVPAAIVGTQPWTRKIFGFIPWFSFLEVRFGKAMDLEFEKKEDSAYDRHKAFQGIAEQILNRIRELRAGGSGQGQS